jgi:hypothetical protein
MLEQPDLPVIWYPVMDQRALRCFYQDLAGAGAPKLLRVGLLVYPLDTPNSLDSEDAEEGEQNSGSRWLWKVVFPE